MKVSIITICYNAEKTLEATLKSVIEQTYHSIEYVIIDGASTDKTLSILEKYKNNISVLLSEPDKGIYDAMNKGLEKSTGDYVLFMNAGDRFAEKESLQKIIETSEGKDFIYGKTMYYNFSGEQEKWHKPLPNPKTFSAKSFLYGMVICHQSMLVRRKIALKYDMKYKISADLDWTIKVLKQARSTFFYDAVFCHYLGEGFSAINHKKAVKERFNICVKHFGLFPTILANIQMVFRYFLRKIIP